MSLRAKHKVSRKTGNNWMSSQKKRDIKNIQTNDKKKKKGRPNRTKRTAPRPGQWKCVCGVWNVDELPSCDRCKRLRPGNVHEGTEGTV